MKLTFMPHVAGVPHKLFFGTLSFVKLFFGTPFYVKLVFGAPQAPHQEQVLSASPCILYLQDHAKA